MASKKVVHTFDLFYDLLVKLNNVFKDVYIIDHKYCIPGKETDTEALGDILCTLNEKYIQVLEKMNFSNQVYITNIRLFKAELKEDPSDYDVIKEKITRLVKENKVTDDKLEKLCYMLEADPTLEELYEYLEIPDDSGEMKEYLTSTDRRDTINQYVLELEDSDILQKCRGMISVFTTEFQKPVIWENMGLNKDLIQSIYRDKRIFNMPIPKKSEDDKESYITIAKQLFPIVTEKTIDGAFMNLSMDEKYENLYVLLIDFLFTHFRFQAIYHFIPTKNIQ